MPASSRVTLAALALRGESARMTAVALTLVGLGFFLRASAEAST